MAGEELPRVEVSSLKELRNWLIANHATSASAWPVIWKKADAGRHVPYDSVVEELLCFGWVDSLPRKLDEQRSMLLISESVLKVMLPLPIA